MTLPTTGPGGGGLKGVTGGTGDQPYTELPYAGPDGWYFLKFFDGSVALVYLKDHAWQWTKGHAPAGHGEITPYYLGTSQDIETNPNHLNGLLKTLANAKQRTVIIAAIDSRKGLSQFVTQAGKASGTSPGSEVSGGGLLNPNPPGHLTPPSLPSLASILGFLGSGSFWAGLGMCLAGAGLVAFGVFQLAGVGKTTAIRVLK